MAKLALHTERLVLVAAVPKLADAGAITEVCQDPEPQR